MNIETRAFLVLFSGNHINSQMNENDIRQLGITQTDIGTGKFTCMTQTYTSTVFDLIVFNINNITLMKYYCNYIYYTPS